MQSRWNILHFVLLAASIGVWYGSAFVITSTISLDFDWYHVSLHQKSIQTLKQDDIILIGISFLLFIPQVFDYLTKNSSYWLSVVWLIFVVLLKDLAINAYSRHVRYKPVHILQEVKSIHLLSCSVLYCMSLVSV
jgi:hypothetical protein